MRIKKVMPVIIVTVIIILGIIGATICYIFSRETIEYGKLQNSNISKEEAKNSSPVIVNNLLVGATYKNKWVKADDFFDNSPKSPIKISTFIEGGKTGAYDVSNYRKNPDGHKEIFVDSSYKNFRTEYIAVEGEASEIMQRKIEKVDKEEYKNYEKYVKKEISKLLVPNKTVKVRNVYKVEIEEGKLGTLVVATSKNGKEKGVYSCVCYIEDGKSTLLKLNYIKDVKKSALWPMYNVKFVCDLNNDNKYEVVIEEVTEFDVTYSVFEKKNNSFVEVLNTTCEIKSKDKK